MQTQPQEHADDSRCLLSCQMWFKPELGVANVILQDQELQKDAR